MWPEGGAIEQRGGDGADILSRTHTVRATYRQANLRQVMLRNMSLFYVECYVVYSIFCKQLGSSFVEVHPICFVH